MCSDGSFTDGNEIVRASPIFGLPASAYRASFLYARFSPSLSGRAPFSSSTRRNKVVPPGSPSADPLPNGAQVITPKVSRAGASSAHLAVQPYVLTRWRRYLQNLGRVTLIVIVAATGTFIYSKSSFLMSVEPDDQLLGSEA